MQNSKNSSKLQSFVFELSELKYFKFISIFQKQIWLYREKTNQFQYGATDKCLDFNVYDDDRLLINDCDENSDTQKWKLENFNSTHYKKSLESGPFEDDLDFTDMTIKL